MIAESDVTRDPGARRLAGRLLRQGASLDRLARSRPTRHGVHRLRVLTRRMRAACSAARRLAPSDEIGELARRLRRLGRALGNRRTLDVAAADYAELSGGKTHPALEKARDAADTKLRRSLRPRHRKALASALRDAAARLRSAEPRTGALKRFLETRKKRLASSLGAVTKDELHGLRIEAKKTRYALETARAMGRPGTRTAERTLKRLQRKLGRIHDLESLRALLPKGHAVGVRAASRESSLRKGLQPLVEAVRQEGGLSL